MDVRFTPSARRQVLSAIEYVRARRPSAAGALLERMGRELRRLERFPDSGRTLPEFPELAFREVVVPPYRVFYRVKGDAVWVVAVWHDAQIADVPEEDAGP